MGGWLFTIPFDNFFEAFNVFTWSQTASHTLVDENQYNKCNVNIWIINASEPHALDDLSAPLSTLELFEDQNNNKFCQLILGTSASYRNSRFYEDDN